MSFFAATGDDLGATGVAFVLLGLFVVAPGYVLGAWLDVFGFSRRSLPGRLAVGICLSIAVVPVAVYLNWLALPSAPWALCAVCWVALPVLVIRAKRHGDPRGALSRSRVVVLAAVGGWLVAGALSLVDLQLGQRLYMPLVSYDYTTRAAFTAAIARTGVPPVNPYFYVGHGYILRYHYFWYLLCGLVERMAGHRVSGRTAVIAGTLWSGVGLVAVIALYVQRFRGERPEKADRRMMVAVALLGVTGLDLVPNAIMFLLSGRFNASSEWWNEPVWSWVNSVLWQPHSIAALVACATGLLLMRESSRSADRRFHISGMALGAAALASAAGMSIYTAFVFGSFLVVWIVWLLTRGRRTQPMILTGAGVGALLLLAPYVAELSRRIGGNAHGAIQLTIRSFYFAEALVGEASTGSHWKVALADLVSLPLNYFLEFGFFFVVAVKQWQRLRRQESLSDDEACGVALLLTSVVLCTFLRSNTIANNDLGWRGMILAQFVLLLWAADLWDDGLFPAKRRWRSAVGAMVMLGAAATVYDVTMQRMYPVLLDELAIPRYHWLAPDQKLGERTYALRQVYEELRWGLPEMAVVQQNPDVEPADVFSGMYVDRQAAAETASCGEVFGGSTELCDGILKPIRLLFAGSSGLEPVQVDALCKELSISAVVVKDTDAVWGDRGSWVWKKEPVIENGFARAFRCGIAR